MLIPVPHELQYYIQPSQVDNYFSIEHYFPLSLLKENNMIIETAIPNIYKVTDGGKIDFAKKIAKIKNANLYKSFIIFFKEIDKLTGININYQE